MAQGQELERLFITLLADDSKLRQQLGTILREARRSAEEMSRAFEQGASRGFEDASNRVERSARRQTAALDPVKKALEGVKNETASLRNTVEAGTTSNEKAIERFKQLRDTALQQAGAFDRTSKEYRGFTQAAAQASRSIATLEGRVTKLGFSANNAVGVSEALRQNIGLLGPRGTAAARAIGQVETALGGFARTGPGVTGAIDGVVRGMTRLQAILPLIAVAAAGAAIAGLVRFGNAAAKVADEIDKGARSAGLSAEAYQELRFAFDQNGVSAERFDTLMQGLNQRLGQAAQGSRAQGEAFARLGVEIRDASGNIRGTEEVLRDVIQGLQDLPSAAERAAAGMDVLGRAGRELGALLDTGVEGIDALRASAREMGLVVSGDAIISLVEYKDTMATLQRQFETARIEITAGFIPVLTDLLIPLLQNTIVPLLQSVAERVQTFTSALRDTGPAGVEFRTELANQIAPLAVFVAQLKIAHASLRLLAINFDLSAQRTRAWVLSIGQAVESAPDSVKRLLGLAPSAPSVSGGRDSSGGLGAGLLAETERVIERLEADAERIEGILTDAFVTLQDPSAAVLEIIEGLAASVREGATAFAGLGDAADDAGRAIAGVATAPIGSLAAFREQATAARRDFERAITDEARNAALEREAIALAEVAAITRAFATPDALSAARAWTERLAAELRFGLKDAATVIDLVQPRLEELREEAAQALQDFGFDSQQYQDTLGKLQILEALLDSIGRPRDVTVTPSLTIGNVTEEVRDWARTLAAELRFGLTSSAEAIDLLLPRIEELRASAVDALSEFGVDSEEYRAVIADLNAVEQILNSLGRPVQLTITPIINFGGVEESVLDLAGRLAAELRFGLADSLDVVDILQPKIDELTRKATEALQDFGFDSAQYQSIVRDLDALLALLGTLGDPIDITVTPRIIVAGNALDVISEEVRQRLDAAAAAAEVFGTEAGLAATQASILAAEINRILADDPNADVSALAALWQTYAENARDAADATRDFDTASNALEGVRERIAQLSGTAVSEFERFREVVIAAFDFGVIDTTQLDEYLAVIEGLPATIDAISLDSIAEQLERDLGVAAAAASAFGDETAGAAEKQRLLEAAIRATLALDPTADVGEWVEAWRAYQDAVEDATDAGGGLAAAYAELAQLTGTIPSQFDRLITSFRNAEAAGKITREEFERLSQVIGELKEADAAAASMEAFAAGLGASANILSGVEQGLAGISEGDWRQALRGATDVAAVVGQLIGTAVGGPLVGAAVGEAVRAVGGIIESAVGIFQTLNDIFTGDNKARRELARALTATVAGAFRNGILDGLKGGEDWQDKLRENVTEAIVGALVDAFIQAAVIGAIFQPFIDEFTKILNREGVDAAFEFFDRDFQRALDDSVEVAEKFVKRWEQIFPRGSGPSTGPSDALSPTGTIELPNATVTVLAAPQWALELNTSAQRMSEAGTAMLEAANLMQDTFRDGIHVSTSSGRGIDANRAAA